MAQLWIQVVTAIIAAVASLLAAWIASKGRKEIKEVRVEVNSRLTELLRANATASYAEGRLQGRTEIRQEVAAAKQAEKTGP